MGRSNTNQETIEVVCGAGGAKGPGLIGAFRLLEERNVAVGKLTGVSIGSLMSSFYANGYSADELAEMFIEDQLRQVVADRMNSLAALLSPAKFFGLGVINMRPVFEEIVRKYELRPQPNLRIVAYNICTRQPVVFEGTRYNLAEALTASCCIPGLMRPVLYLPRNTQKQFVSRAAADSMARPGILVDGGTYHMQPSEFCRGRAIVLRLGSVTQFPTYWLQPLEAYFHGLEMMAGRFISMFQPDSPDKDIVIDVGPKDVGGISFSVTAGKCREMIENGYRATATAIDRAIRLGHVPVTA